MKRIFFFFALVWSLNIYAQDIHFTNFQLAPMSLNPALAGDFEGHIRANGIYRDQNSGGYNTMAGGLEYNVPFGFRKQDWITIGVEYVNDRERVVDGINAVNLTQTNIALAYHFPFDKKYKNVLTAAIQYKIMSSKVDGSGLQTRSDLVGNSSVSNNPTILAISMQDENSKGKSLKDYLGALSFKSKFRKKDFFSVGMSFAHVFRVDKSIASTASTGRVDVLPMRITGYVQSEVFLNNVISLQPIVYIQNQGKFAELAVQTLVGLELNAEKNIKINPGLGYRIGDAAEFLFIMDYGKFKAGLAFDLTLSDYKSSLGQQNGLEFGLSYTTTIVKKPKVKPVIFCPRL